MIYLEFDHKEHNLTQLHRELNLAGLEPNLVEGNEQKKRVRLGFLDDVSPQVLKKAAKVVGKHKPEQVLQQREYGEDK